MRDNLVVKTIGLTKRFGHVLAVNHLDLEIGRGEVFGFLGPNGSGKTTTIGLLMGLIRPDSGSMELFGQDTRHDLPGLLGRVGAVLENSPFYPYLSGRDNLLVFARTSGGIPPERIEEVLDIVRLKPRAGDKAGTYSLGMRQRLAVAAALLNDPELVILDEPTNGLDPSGIIEAREIIHELGRLGKTVFLSSHMLHEVEQVCDHVAIINKGKIIASGPVIELLRGGKRLRLRVTETDKAMTMLKGIDWIRNVEAEDGFIFIEAPEDRSAEINEILVKNGVGISEMRMSESSLEEFFLGALGEAAAGKEGKNV